MEIDNLKLFIIDQLLEKHEIVDNCQSLLDYVELVTGTYDCDQVYSERHHILTSAVFPQFRQESWNIIKLPYEKHVEAHELLFESFHLMTYARCIHFMKSGPKSYHKLSVAIKRGWIKFKSSEKYHSWREKRVLCMRARDREWYSVINQKRWDSITQEDYDAICASNRKSWTIERRQNKSKQQAMYSKNNKEKIREVARNRWKNESPEYREAFREKMTIVNGDESKRLKAGETIKKRWKDPIFLEKMTHRRTWVKYICISPKNEWHEFASSRDAVNELGFNKNLVRIFMNTDKSVPAPKKQANSDQNKSTIGWKFYKFTNKELGTKYLTLKETYETNKYNQGGEKGGS